ncbi:carbohydrate ABC transporter permease [Amycolatopsis jiangsuensis]|uniref:Raffinose/stachyose/melibiose transport system permease protein n=1 Tax=Amycolatopsis jiangsuensis TaxID=1181879 RepID=A0A840INH2_9PSEU|nr:carbohydrate ABC transporter permease [Amycolatopsis jiangsuensis]MBB4683971.1 raffinose/stachyose/melibiose transport system permease protein [Amycolatopsis jiangsuensis]
MSTTAAPASPWLGPRGRFVLGRTTVYVVLTALAIFAVGPIVLFFFNALKTDSQYAEGALGLPKTWEWGNFTTAWTQANMGAGLVNSLVVVAGTIVLTCAVAACAAYALARIKVRGGSAFMTYLLVASALPSQLFLIPLFYLWAKAGLYDTRFGLILIYCGLFSPFATLLLRSFMLGLPRELEEAARVDGAGELRVFLRIVLPNVLPGLLTVALTTGLSAYNEFLFAVTMIQSDTAMPLSTTFFTFQQGFTQNFTLISAAGFIMIAPMLVLFLLLQRRFISGLANSGMGGM